MSVNDSYIKRRNSRLVKVGNMAIGGDSPISIQSMTNTKTANVINTVNQINELKAAGCEIIRLAVPDMDSAKALKEIKSKVDIPMVADIHFDYRLAIEAIKSGVDKLRLNPGNIGDRSRIEKVIIEAKAAGIPIRIGVNGGSLEKDILEKHGGPTSQALAESALRHVNILEELDFNEIIIALKTSDIIRTIESYELLASKVDYPFHIGITESGTTFSGTVKSSIGVGGLLLRGLGDTMRISLTGDPVNEVKVAKEILKGLGIRQLGPKIISCPTCGRCNIDLEKIALAVEKAVESSTKNVTIAVMGCIVNGPGEAKEADFGIAGGKDEALLFRKGEPVTKLPYDEIFDALMAELENV